MSLSVGLIYFFLFISPKSGPSEARLESEEETEADLTTCEPEEQGFAPDEEFIDVRYS